MRRRNNQGETPELVAILTAPEYLMEATAGEDGLHLSPLALIGFSNMGDPYGRGEGHPVTETWYRSSIMHGLWFDDFGHTNKKSGACDCGDIQCSRLGVVDVRNERMIEYETKKALERAAWFQKLEERRGKSRAYNEERKRKIESGELVPKSRSQTVRETPTEWRRLTNLIVNGKRLVPHQEEVDLLSPDGKAIALG